MCYYSSIPQNDMQRNMESLKRRNIITLWNVLSRLLAAMHLFFFFFFCVLSNVFFSYPRQRSCQYKDLTWGKLQVTCDIKIKINTCGSWWRYTSSRSSYGNHSLHGLIKFPYYPLNLRSSKQHHTHQIPKKKSSYRFPYSENNDNVQGEVQLSLSQGLEFIYCYVYLPWF